MRCTDRSFISGFRIGILLLALLSTTLNVSPALAFDEIPVEIPEPPGEITAGPFFQFAWLYRFSETSIYPTKSWPQWSTDVGYTFSHNDTGNWGVGLRMSLDADSNRWGVGALRKWWLDKKKYHYFQVNPGVMLVVNDDKLDADLPGWYVELELGWGPVAWVTEYQVVPFKNRYGGYDSSLAYIDLPDQKNGVQTAWLTGMQMTDGHGLGFIVATLLATVLAAASISGY